MIAEPIASPRGGLSIDQIVDAAIDDAPSALRRRLVLQTVDWSGIPAPRVAGMIANLTRQGLALPRWLAGALLVAGHVLPAELVQTPDHRVLNQLNRYAADKEGAISAADIDPLAARENIEPDIVRAIVTRLRAMGASADACRLALAHWRDVPQAMRPIRPDLAAYLAALPPLKISVAGFSTTDPLAADLSSAFGAHGRNALVTQSDFGGAITALLQPDPGAEAHVVLMDLDGFAATDWRIPVSQIGDLMRERADILSNALDAFAARTSAPLLINCLPAPSAPTAGLLDRRYIAGRRQAVELVNGRLLEAADRHGNILVMDADQALGDIPAARHSDPKLWYYGRVAYSADATRALACAFAEAWSLAMRGPAKVLALDLDNTLWGGTYGEDGLEGLACGEDFPGNAFRAFQQECLRLKQQGLLLVALSKNNADAVTVFERHPGMALKASDFAASAINWQPKPENIRRIAGELNLGLDSFVFIDDSPHEREAMRRLVPEVVVPELPEDPASRPLWLRGLKCTWPVRLTEEDARRSEMYAAERQARALKSSAATREDYLAGLEQRLIVETVNADTLGRVAQMHQRTNQFNLTTLRLTEAEIGAYVRDPKHGFAFLGRVADKFGDHGIVVAATISVEGSQAQIDTFLMSCRVIGREVERAFLGTLLTFLAKRGIERVVGRFAATAKNGLVRDFYAANGFARVDGTEEESSWAFDLRVQTPPRAEFVSVQLEA
ncbi:MAG: HAD-IIIC family phosphatase [Hyphomicrobiaceae bacterium]|nr:MAG: HAD-IIIC family phosphatase [Hyphomicrobiaceae bacterium]